MTIVRSVLITGTTSGLGKSLVRSCLDAGFEVIAVNRRDVTIPAADAKRVRTYICDISSPSAVKRLILGLLEENILPQLFILNAGINRLDNETNINLQEFDSVLKTNLFGNLTFISAVQQLKIVERKFIAISSTSVIVPNSTSLGYWVSKVSIQNIFKMLRSSDLANRYQVVLLGPTTTNLNTELAPLKGIAKSIFDLLKVEPAFVAGKIIKFSTTESFILYPSWKARIFYPILKIILQLVPRIYYKPYQERPNS